MWLFVFSGLLGGHSMAVMLKDGGQHMQWYKDELLHMAKDLGLRLLPAFNTSSGLPYPRVRRTISKTPQFSLLDPAPSCCVLSLNLHLFSSIEHQKSSHDIRNECTLIWNFVSRRCVSCVWGTICFSSRT